MCTLPYQDKWPRQKIEDGDLATNKWAPDCTDTDAVDPDSITKTPKPPKDFEPDLGSDAGREKGKSTVSNRQTTNEGEEDCQIIEVFNILPISHAYLMSSTSADTGGHVTEPSRGTKRTSDAPAKMKTKPPKKKLRQTQLGPLRPKVRLGVVA